MINLEPHLRAEVMNIRPGRVSPVDKILVDANVLYFCYYTKFDQLDILEEGPRTYQTSIYPAFLQKLLSAGSTLFVHKIGLIEFTRLVETAELQILYCKVTGKTNIGDDFSKKNLRFNCSDDYHKIQGQLATYFNVIMKAFKLFNSEKPIDRLLLDFLGAWQDSLGDPSDAVMISEAKQEGVYAFLSDDADFATFKDIKLYTANKIAIEAYESCLKEKRQLNKS